MTGLKSWVCPSEDWMFLETRKIPTQFLSTGKNAYILSLQRKGSLQWRPWVLLVDILDQFLGMRRPKCCVSRNKWSQAHFQQQHDNFLLGSPLRLYQHPIVMRQSTIECWNLTKASMQSTHLSVVYLPSFPIFPCSVIVLNFARTFAHVDRWNQYLAAMEQLVDWTAKGNGDQTRAGEVSLDDDEVAVTHGYWCRQENCTFTVVSHWWFQCGWFSWELNMWELSPFRRKCIQKVVLSGRREKCCSDRPGQFAVCF